MAQMKLSKRKIQKILRLKHQNQLTIRQIAGSLGLPSSTVGDYLKRAEAAGIRCPLPEGQDEKQLLDRLMVTAPPESERGPGLPDWPSIRQKPRRKSVTRSGITVDGSLRTATPIAKSVGCVP